MAANDSTGFTVWLTGLSGAGKTTIGHAVAAELEMALAVPGRLIGINNRDLHSFEVALDTTYALLDRIPADRIVVTESGIGTAEDVAAMRAHGVHAFLVGESLMRAPDPGQRLRELFGT
mgnify:CR=1 FL=1